MTGISPRAETGSDAATLAYDMGSSATYPNNDDYATVAYPTS